MVYFREKNDAYERGVKEQQTVCLVDEIDYLLTKDEDVVYNFFTWSLRAGSE